MPAILCLHPEVKEYVIKALERLHLRDELIQPLRDLEECENGSIRFGEPIKKAPAKEVDDDFDDDDEEEPVQAAKPAKKKSSRPRSAYQQHTSDCMKGGQHTMKECAAQWRAKKGA